MRLKAQSAEPVMAVAMNHLKSTPRTNGRLDHHAATTRLATATATVTPKATLASGQKSELASAEVSLRPWRPSPKRTAHR
jgi:hypothetical protein